MKLKLGKLDDFLYTVLVLAIISLSGSLWGWTTPYPLYTEFIIVIYFLAKKINNKSIVVNKSHLYIFLFIITVYLINFGLIARIDLWGQKSIFFNFFAVYICIMDLSYDKYTDKYIYCMVALAAINVVFWCLGLMGIQFLASNVSYGDGLIYNMNPFVVYRFALSEGAWMYPAYRNFGMFWEPGCYQSFLNLALLFFVQKIDVNWMKNRKKLFEFVVLVITILSTMSTTGYILLAINILILYMRMMKKMNKKTAIIFLCSLGFMAVVLSSSVIADKFNPSSVNYSSYATRLNDNISGIKVAFHSPIWGLGHISKKYIDTLLSYNITANSSGILRTIQEFGIPFGVWYFIRQCYSLMVYGKRREIPRLARTLYCIFLFVLLSSEPISTNPAFFALVFTLPDAFKNSKEIPAIRGMNIAFRDIDRT